MAGTGSGAVGRGAGSGRTAGSGSACWAGDTGSGRSFTGGVVQADSATTSGSNQGARGIGMGDHRQEPGRRLGPRPDYRNKLMISITNN
jgi:hypothetical protein